MTAADETPSAPRVTERKWEHCEHSGIPVQAKYNSDDLTLYFTLDGKPETAGAEIVAAYREKCVSAATETLSVYNNHLATLLDNATRALYEAKNDSDRMAGSLEACSGLLRLVGTTWTDESDAHKIAGREADNADKLIEAHRKDRP